MATEKDIKKELLRKLEIDAPGPTKEEYTTEKILQKYKNQQRRLKKIAIIGWIITAISALVICNLKVYFLDNDFDGYLTKGEFWFRRFSDMAVIVLVISAFLITYLVYHKSKTLTMLQICAKLANIENYLKKISPDK
jgi:uncharacterized membrane protein YdbT with pleckstrin-like domain